jgi:hypothetical protein
MPLPEQWATPEDFATLFQYFWHRDFPIDSRSSTGARRVDWTIHIGIVVRSMGDLMGLVTRFERGGRKDAVLRSRDGDEVAVEWEWDGVWGNELKKLREHRVWRPKGTSERPLKYGVLITYTHTLDIEKVYDHVKQEWKGAKWPLLLILVDLDDSKKFSSGKEFKDMHICLFDTTGRRNLLRESPAFPWNVESSRWLSRTLFP